MPENIRPAMYRKQKDRPVPSGYDLYRPPQDDVSIHAPYGEDVADRAVEHLRRLRASDSGPFYGHDQPTTRRVTVEETTPPPTPPPTPRRNPDADSLEDRRYQTRKLGY